MDSVMRGAFATHLRELRIAAGLTQEELAARSGVSARSISDLERGINLRPQRETATMLCDGLDLSGADRDTFLDLARRLPRQKTLVAAPTLPPVADPLLGREAELEAIINSLSRDRVRLLTLTGPGGIGKTRLAIEAAHRLAAHFVDGVVFVRLEALSDPSQVIPAIAGAMQLTDGGGESPAFERLSAQLASHDLLLVLDNLEHLLTATGELSALLSRTPNVHMLVTSRESLRTAGEHVLAVAPLPRPELAAGQAAQMAHESSPAVQLFVQRALSRRRDLEVDAATPEGLANLERIAETCHRLDGLPLAIELAAAQAEVLSPAAILSLLANAGLTMLASGDRDRPARMQTMDAAIAWSYDFLTVSEQALFRALSVFAGGFTLMAADWVSRDAHGLTARDGEDDAHPVNSAADPDLVRAVASLARQNLLFQDTTATGASLPRFRMLEPLRLFALDRMRAAGEESMARLRHAEYFAASAEALDALTLGPDPEIWFEQQALELDNVRAAIDWALAHGEHALAVHITVYVAQFWLLRGLHAEGRQRVAAAIAVDAAAAPADRWFARFWATILAFDSGDVAAAREHAQALLAIAEASDDQIGVGAGLTLMSQVVGADPDGHEEASLLAQRAVDVLEALGQDEWTASAWARLGIEYQNLGRVEEAREYFLHSLMLRRRMGCEGCTAYSHVLLGSANFDLGRPHEAVAAYRECLSLAFKEGNQPLTFRALLGLGDVAWRYGASHDRARSALLFWGASEAVRHRHGFTWSAPGTEIVARWQAPMRREIGDESVNHLIADGMALSQAALLELALDLDVVAASCACSNQEERVSLVRALGSIE